MILVYLCGAMDVASVFQPADPELKICKDFNVSCKTVKLKTFIFPQRVKKKIGVISSRAHAKNPYLKVI